MVKEVVQADGNVQVNTRVFSFQKGGLLVAIRDLVSLKVGLVVAIWAARRSGLWVLGGEPRGSRRFGQNRVPGSGRYW